MKTCSLILAASILHQATALDLNSLNRRQAISSIATSSAASSLLAGTAATGFPQSSSAADSVIAQVPTVPSIILPTPPTVKVPLVKQFPLASFGLQIYDNDTAYKLTTDALEVGYRNFFASVLAGNQKGFAQAIRDSNIPRDELYICGSVLSNRATTYSDAYKLTTRGCMENLSVMNKNSNGKIDYLDMIMLDYPTKSEEGVIGQWDSFLEFQNDQHVAHLAVSNFNARQLDLCIKNETGKNGSGVIPTVNQLPVSIANHPRGMMEENSKRGVHVQSWSPLSSTLPRYKNAMKEVGERYVGADGQRKSAAQVGLRWVVQNGGSYCVQSKKSTHFAEDLNVFDFELSQRDMDLLNGLSPPIGF